MSKRVSSDIIENTLKIFMILTALAAIYILYIALNMQTPDPMLAIIELLLIILIVNLGFGVILVKIWEQHMSPDYVHKKTHERILEHISEIKNSERAKIQTKARKTSSKK